MPLSVIVGAIPTGVQNQTIGGLNNAEIRKGAATSITTAKAE